MIVYVNDQGQLFVREKNEFLEKFDPVDINPHLRSLHFGRGSVYAIIGSEYKSSILESVMLQTGDIHLDLDAYTFYKEFIPVKLEPGQVWQTRFSNREGKIKSTTPLVTLEFSDGSIFTGTPTELIRDFMPHPSLTRGLL